jgi:hypothetical protein
VPHWFGSTGDEPAEILSIFGRPGERMTVRTTPPQDLRPRPPVAPRARGINATIDNSLSNG